VVSLREKQGFAHLELGIESIVQYAGK
jgi:hypothetical protein